MAPLVVVAGRWHRRDGVATTAWKVVRVATAFTVGHSLTLLASALGWVSVPSAPVEVLVAASVGVSALHALRPLARGGEEVIAGGFGLVHGLAFAGILAELGLDGSASILALLAFNVCVELAQLVTIAVIFPSLYLASRTRSYPALRIAGASIALAAATAWGLERLGVLENPFAPVEDALIAQPMWVVAGLALICACCWLPRRNRGNAQLADEGPAVAGAG